MFGVRTDTVEIIPWHHIRIVYDYSYTDGKRVKTMLSRLFILRSVKRYMPTWPFIGCIVSYKDCEH